MSSGGDWRLQAVLEVSHRPGRTLDALIRRLRSPEAVTDAAVADDVVLTHDGNMLFAYAPTRPALDGARAAVEAALHADGTAARVYVSHWDERVDEWVQVEPALAGEARQAAEARERDAEKLESRTLVALVGKLIRSELEQTMSDGAEKLGLECEIHEHPHLLSSQIAFTVTGPKRKLDEFAQDLRQEEILTMRAQRRLMLSPL
jgi:hypothetical protein